MSASGHRQRGLTLIELMVALAVFAVLGVLAWRGSSQLIDGEAQIGTELARWRDIQRALTRLETDLLQIVPPPGTQPPPQGATPSLLEQVDGEPALSFLTLVSGGQGVRRVAWVVQDRTLQWWRWPGRDPAALPERDILLEEVLGLEVAYSAGQGWLTDWPPANLSPASLPVALRITLKLADVGPVTRIHALR